MSMSFRKYKYYCCASQVFNTSPLLKYKFVMEIDCDFLHTSCCICFYLSTNHLFKEKKIKNVMDSYRFLLNQFQRTKKKITLKGERSKIQIFV